MNDLPVHVYVAMEANDALVRLELDFFPLAAITPLAFQDYITLLVPCSHSCVVHASVGLGIKAHSESYDYIIRAGLSGHGLPSITWPLKISLDTTRLPQLITYAHSACDTCQESICAETQ